MTLGLPNRSDLVCHRISVKFGGTLALNRLDLTFSAGSIIGLVGPNGAGKTTLADVVTGYVRPFEGSCEWLGESLTKLAPHSISCLGAARTFQKPRVINSLGVVENVLVAFRKERVDSFWGAMKWSGGVKHEQAMREYARETLARLGMETRSRDLAGGLSFSEKKMLAFSCVLASGARMLLLDEPFAGLDEGMRPTLARCILEEKASGKIIILIEHDMGVIRSLADKVALLNRGMLIREGTPADVIKGEEILDAYAE